SSRRRHTRSYGDWSSDVCSSDLHKLRGCRTCSALLNRPVEVGTAPAGGRGTGALDVVPSRKPGDFRRGGGRVVERREGKPSDGKIGRASCRERGEMGGGAGRGVK